MKHTVVSICIFLFFIQSQQAQAPEKIDTDRPDQTESPYTVPEKYFQCELGFGKENFKPEGYALAYPAFLLKYGISKRFELRIESNFITEHSQSVFTTKNATLLDPVEIGAKISLLEEKNILPKTSLIVHAGLPFTSTDYDGRQKCFTSFRFTMQNSLFSNIGIGYNLGAEWDGYSNAPAWIYTLSPNLNIGKKWYAYVEAFGFFKHNQCAQHNLDGGLAFYSSSNTKIDVSAGTGLGASLLKNYVAVGFSFRFPVKEN